MPTIAVYIGSEADGTKQIFGKQPWEQFFEPHDVEVFGSASLPASVRDYYSRYHTTARTAEDPLTKIINGYRDCREYLSDRTPDVLVQLMRTPTHGPSVAIAGWVANIPTVTRISGDLFHQYAGYGGIANQAGAFLLNHVAGRIITQCSTKTVVLGPYGKAQLLARGAEQEDLYVVPPILREDSRFDPPDAPRIHKEALGLPTDRPVALYTGRLSQQKGMNFLSTVIKLTSRETDLLYVLAGTGSYRERFTQTFNREHVRLPGRVPYDNIHEYYKAADVYIHPSPYEGIPLSILEALHCDTPVVARDAGDISFVTPNVVDSPEQMATMILEEEYDATWLNKEHFETEKNRWKIQALLQDTVS